MPVAPAAEKSAPASGVTHRCGDRSGTGRTARPASQSAEFPRSRSLPTAHGGRRRAPSRAAARGPARVEAFTVRRALETLGLERLLVTRLPNVRWLTGFDGSSGEVLIERDRVVLIVDGRYVESAEALAAHAGDLIRVERVAQTHDETLARSSPVPRPRPGSRPPISLSRGTSGCRAHWPAAAGMPVVCARR